MLKRSILSLVCVTAMMTNAQQGNVPVNTGAFEPKWESLDAWECPEWFKDAKFGIWAHWGPQCHAEAGDWYARFMYYEGSGQNQWHYNHFGDPDVFGLKDLCNDWKAQNWDPEALVNLYKSVGARYFMALGNHHDNFDLWNSPYQEWNSVNVGPKKDIVKGWSDACKKAGLPLGVSIHASHAWTWLEPSQEYDGNLTKEDGYKLNPDGTEKWWKGMDPQELYAQNHAHSTGWENSGTIHSQWDWANGASLPSDEYKTKFQNRVLELINDYDPAILYFDDTAMPFYGCDDAVGLNILSHYYNHSAEKNGGEPSVIVTGKQLTKAQKQHMMWDVERGIPDKIQDEYWQTCTCIGDWHYNQATYNNGNYKSAQQVVNMLVDIVSKNGNLLLSVPVKSDGTIDEKEEAVLNDIKAWMDINSSSIYGTRPWKTFGEGPLAEASHALNAQGFNEGNNYSSKDVAYCQRNDTLFATIMRWPKKSTFTFKSLSMGSEYYSGKVKKIELIGYGEVDFSENIDGLTVTLPETKPNPLAPVFQMTFIDGTANVSLSEIIPAYEEKANAIMASVSYDTGKYSKEGVQTFLNVIEEAKSHLNDTEANQKVVMAELNEAYKTLNKEGKNQPEAPNDDAGEDYTVYALEEASNFTSTDCGSRFGTPDFWTVENFNVPVKDASAGVKNGIDNYPGYNTLCLGLWSGEDVEPYTSDLANARIYRTVRLEPGRYFFGHKLECCYNVPDLAYIYAADKVLDTEDVEDMAIAYAHVNQAEVGSFYGINFTVKEEKDIVLCFQANMADGPGQQEFRIQEVKLLYYGNMDFEALSQLISSAFETLDNTVINSNTGFYKQEAADKLYAAIVAAEEISDESTEEEFAEAYNTLQLAVKDYMENGRNVGGAPSESNSEDITTSVLGEATNFARTDETLESGRFGAPKNWIVDNFGFGNEAGIDNITGSDCLHLEVWWNSSAFADNGYDIRNARIYQKATLPAGRYFFGASYPSAEANEELYIFASQDIIGTEEISSLSLAYEKVKLAPADGTFRGIYFTLEEEGDVYIGFQADFSAVSTANLRASAVKLLYYGEITYEKIGQLISDIDDVVATLTFNDNTGYYSKDALAQLQEAIVVAKQLPASATYEEITLTYNALSDAYADFLEKGKNAGGQPQKLDATDITEKYMVESSDFSRTDPSSTARFATPAYWTVENFMIDKGGEGIKNGIDKYPGYSCLSLGIWNDLDTNTGGESSDARLYRTVTLPAGRYYFGAEYNTTYNMSPAAYIFAADYPLHTADIPTSSIAYYPINKAGENDGLVHGIYFTLDKEQEVTLGFQADLTKGAGTQEFRAKSIVLYGYNYDDTVSIEDCQTDDETHRPRFFTLTGVELQQIPQSGVYIIRRGKDTFKVLNNK